MAQDDRDVVIRISAVSTTKAEFDKARKQLQDFGKAQGFVGGTTKKLTGELNQGLNRALQQAANQGGFATSALSKLGPAGLAAAAAVGTLALGFRELIQESKRLTDESRKLGISTDEYQKALGVSIALSEEAIATGNRLSKTWDNAYASARNFALNGLAAIADEFTRINELDPNSLAAQFGFDSSRMGFEDIPIPQRLGGNKPSADVNLGLLKNWTEEMSRSWEEQTRGIEVEKERTEAIKKATEAQKRHDEQMAKIWAELNAEGIPTIMDLGKSLDELSKPVLEQTQFAKDYADALMETQSRIDVALATAAEQPFRFEAGFRQAGLLSGIELQQAQATAKIPKIVPLKLEDDLDAFGLSLESAADLAQVFGDSLGTFGEALTQGSSAADLWNRSLKEGTHEIENWGQALTGLAAGVLAIANATGSGSTGSRVGGGALAGAALGTSILPGFGTAIGAGVGALVGFLRGRGPSQVGEDAGRDIGASLSQALMEEIHKSGENAQLFLREIFSEGGLGLDRLAEEAGDLFSFLQRGEISESTLLGEMNELLPILIEHFDELGETGRAQIDRITSAAEQAGIDLGEMGDQLERLQKGIPELTLEGFASQFDLDEAQKAKLQGLGLGIQTEEERVAETLNIPLELLKELAPALETIGVSLAELPEFLEATPGDLAELGAKLELPPELMAQLQALSPPDPMAAANTTGAAVADHLMPGFTNLGRDITTHLDRLGDKLLLGIRDALAQGS